MSTWSGQVQGVKYVVATEQGINAILSMDASTRIRNRIMQNPKNRYFAFSLKGQTYEVFVGDEIGLLQ